MVTGGITITTEDGAVHHFGPGESYLIKRGLKCKFKLTAPTRKLYVIFDNKPH